MDTDLKRLRMQYLYELGELQYEKILILSRLDELEKNINDTIKDLQLIEKKIDSTEFEKNTPKNLEN